MAHLVATTDAVQEARREAAIAQVAEDARQRRALQLLQQLEAERRRSEYVERQLAEAERQPAELDAARARKDKRDELQQKLSDGDGIIPTFARGSDARTADGMASLPERPQE